MVWTAPITAVTGSVFPSATYNQVVRDNLLQTMPALTTTLGSFFATSNTNQIAERVPNAQYIGGLSNTTSTTYTDLASGVVGPLVSCQTGTVAAVFIYNNSYTSAGGTGSWMSFDISGATTQASSDNFALQLQLASGQHCGACFLIDNLVPGLNTFTAKFRTSSGTSYFSSRRLAVWPF